MIIQTWQTYRQCEIPCWSSSTSVPQPVALGQVSTYGTLTGLCLSICLLLFSHGFKGNRLYKKGTHFFNFYMFVLLFPTLSFALYKHTHFPFCSNDYFPNFLHALWPDPSPPSQTKGITQFHLFTWKYLFLHTFNNKHLHHNLWFWIEGTNVTLPALVKDHRCWMFET